MSVQLKPCLIDRCIPTGLEGGGGCQNLEFNSVGRLIVSPREDLFVGPSPETAVAQEYFSKLVSRGVGTPIGMITLRNVYLAGTTGVIIDPDRGVYLWGQTIGWAGAEVASALLCRLYGAVESEGRKVSLRPELFETARLNRSHEYLRLVSAAGHHAYGHWLIDVVPRLLLCEEYSRERQVPFYAPRVPDWGLALAAAAGVDMSNRVEARKELVFARTVEIPTFIRYGVVLDECRSVAAWDKLRSRQSIGRTRGQDEEGALLYVSRARWGSRTLSNAREVEEWCTSYGFLVVHPEAMTLREQMQVFASAHMVIGEDGSGMHNSVFATHHVQVGIISMGRTNMYHPSIANARRHSVGYLTAVRDGSSEDASS